MVLPPTLQDMVKLNYLHEPGVLHNVHSRYSVDAIYTYTGRILIAVNPFQELPYLYSKAMMEEYSDKKLGELSPHAFAIADEAFRNLFDNNRSQSVLVSGESGAGKTETVKLIMQYLAFRGGQAHASDKPVEQQVLQSNPILEAFGNAKTARNDNSSRFGKYVEVQFGKDSAIAGAGIRTYLLERSRVVQTSEPERNYHVFYQLIYGASESEWESLRLRPAREFAYLNSSSVYELPNRSNEHEYEQMREAMRIIGVSEEHQWEALRVVAGVLHLGNIAFESDAEGNATVSEGKGGERALYDCADVLGVETERLRRALTRRRISAPDGEIDKQLEVTQAEGSRDALAKALYSRLFDWVVDAINASIGATGEIQGTVGLLDIYGFECFDKNSFEQFNINHANEKLQQHFNEHVFKNEQAEYEEEGIDWSYIDFIDNQDVLDLIEQRNLGLLPLLDESCRLSSATPRDFTEKVFNHHGSHKRIKRPKGTETDMVITHYAGDVRYSTEAFLEKNTDFVVAEHADVMCKSECTLVRTLFQNESEAANSRVKMKFSSVGSRFKSQLDQLMATLRQTDPHYVRCIKPNDGAAPNQFDNKSVLHQLRCGGVLEAIRISCAGYPARKYFEEFISRYWMLDPESKHSSVDERQLCRQLCERAGVTDFQVGRKKIFLRSGAVAVLDNNRSRILESAIVRIQKCYRMHLCRRRFAKQREACVRIQVRSSFPAKARSVPFLTLFHVDRLLIAACLHGGRQESDGSGLPKSSRRSGGAMLHGTGSWRKRRLQTGSRKPRADLSPVGDSRITRIAATKPLRSCKGHGESRKPSTRSQCFFQCSTLAAMDTSKSSIIAGRSSNDCARNNGMLASCWSRRANSNVCCNKSAPRRIGTKYDALH